MPLYLAQMLYGERLRAVREAAGLSQEGLVQKIRELVAGPGGIPVDADSLSQPAISQLEKSPTATGSKYTAQIAHICGVSALWLAEEIGPKIAAYSTDPRITRAMAVMEKLPEPIKSTAIREVDALAQLADELNQKKASSGTP